MLSKKIALGLSASMFLILAACKGKGGFAGTTTSSSLGGNGATSVLPPLAEPDAFQKLQYKGYVAGGSDSGTLTIDIDKANGALLLIMPLQINAFIENLEAQIPDLPGVKPSASVR